MYIKRSYLSLAPFNFNIKGEWYKMEYIALVAKKIKPFVRLIIFFLVFTISFSIIIGTLKYTIPFIIGLITALI